MFILTPKEIWVRMQVLGLIKPGSDPVGCVVLSKLNFSLIFSTRKVHCVS